MKVNLKTLKGQNFALEVQPDMTIANLKNMVAEVSGHSVETQKLIAMGKVMDDEQKLVRDFKVVEKSTIVLMTLKAKPVKPAAAEEIKQDSVGSNQEPAQQAAAQTQAQVESGPPELPPGVNAEDLNMLVAVTGKSREQCLKALEIAQGNANNACTLILEGNLDQMMARDRPEQEYAPAGSSSQQSTSNGATQFGFSPGIHR